MAKAEKSTDKLNAAISASDASLALTADQRKQINAVNLQKLAARVEMEAKGMSKEEIKASGKADKKKIRAMLMAVLTPEQQAAYKASKSK